MHSEPAIYLDHNATTPLAPTVLEAMLPYFTDAFANAGSTHRAGQQAKAAVDRARAQVAALIGAQPGEIIFTSGATESINLACKGLLTRAPADRRHLVVLATEHKAVLDVAEALVDQGCDVTVLPVQPDGLVDLAAAEAAIRPDTLLVAAMLVNNETGVIQPVRALADLAHAQGALLLCDATQAAGKMPVDVAALGIDLLPLSAHKFYGPKGVGALYARRLGQPRLRLGALLHGGGQERDLRSGTLNVPGIVGMGAAAALAQSEMTGLAAQIGPLRDTLEAGLLALPGSWRNGHPTERLYNVANVGLAGVDADALIMGLGPIAISNGSACTAMSVHPSHVLRAMGRSEAECYSSLRFSLGRSNTAAEIEQTLAAVRAGVARLRR